MDGIEPSNIYQAIYISYHSTTQVQKDDCGIYFYTSKVRLKSVAILPFARLAGIINMIIISCFYLEVL